MWVYEWLAQVASWSRPRKWERLSLPGEVGGIYIATYVRNTYVDEYYISVKRQGQKKLWKAYQKYEYINLWLTNSIAVAAMAIVDN